MFVSSKNGYGSWVVLSSDSSSMSSSGRSVYGEEMSCQKCRGIVLKVLSFSPILPTNNEPKRVAAPPNVWNGAEKHKGSFSVGGYLHFSHLVGFCFSLERGNCNLSYLPCIDPVRWCSETRVNIIRNVGCLIAAFYSGRVVFIINLLLFRAVVGGCYCRVWAMIDTHFLLCIVMNHNL